jgi:hypothetical protein
VPVEKIGPDTCSAIVVKLLFLLSEEHWLLSGMSLLHMFSVEMVDQLDVFLHQSFPVNFVTDSTFQCSDLKQLSSTQDFGK